MYGRGLFHVTAQALVPEQIVSYVTAAGDSRPVLCGGCVAYDREDGRVLIAYLPGSLPGEVPETLAAAMNGTVAATLNDTACPFLTVLGPGKPEQAPDNATIREDAYSFLPLPLAPPGQNLRNMLRRGARECRVSEEPWNDEHGALVHAYLASRPFVTGTRQIYVRIPRYLEATPDALVFAARDGNARLLAFAVGDFSSLTTAFYMFAFRQKDCPPGVADVLLHAIARKATQKGHQFLNLGLGINKGITAFKRKWGETLYLPYVQTDWDARSSQTNPEATHARRGKPFSSGDPLSAFTPPTFGDKFRRFLAGETRPFDCLQIEVTSQCPGKCGYCPHTTKQKVWRSRRMEDETYAALLPLIWQAKRVHLQGWGEPLLHPRFFDYAEVAARVGAAVSTTTYGLAVTPANAEKLIKSGLDIVAFSLTGVDEESNNARSGVPFAGVRKGILALNTAKREVGSELPRIHLAYLMLASKSSSVARLPELMEDLDVPVADVSTLDYNTAQGMAAEAIAPGETEKIDRVRALLHETSQRAETMGRVIHYSLPGETGQNDCYEHIQSCMFSDAEGTIAPCIYVNLPTTENDLYRRVFGSVREKKPMDIWADSDYANFRLGLARGDPDLPCKTCAKRFERIY